MKQIIIISIWESREAYTEINFFEKFINFLKDKFKKIVFLSPFAIDGNLKDKQKFIKEINDEIVERIKIETNNKKLNNEQRITVFCIWDSSKNKSNYQTNFDELQKMNQQYNSFSLIFSKGIELGLFDYILEKRTNDIDKLAKKIGYENKSAFKKKSNENLFFTIMEKAKINIETDSFIKNLKKRFEINEEKNLLKMLKIIKKINTN